MDELAIKEVLLCFISPFTDFDDVEWLRKLRNDIETQPDRVIEYINGVINVCEEDLIDKNICPVCGASLNLEENTYYYKEYDKVCSACGYRKEQ